MKVREYLDKEINIRLVRLQEASDQLYEAYSTLSQIRYVVTIRSAWAREGEKSVNTEGSDLEETFRRAQEKFKRVNRRSDVQGDYSVQARLGKALFLLPKNFYEHLK